jgi:hypothetical protein
MPLYHLVLRTTDRIIPDPDGTEWPNEAAARDEAVGVARDLMRNQEVKARSWRLHVCDENLWSSSELLFAEIDDTILHLPPQLRDQIIFASRSVAAMSDALLALAGTLAKFRDIQARWNTLRGDVFGKEE